MAEHPATERLWGAIDERRDELIQSVADLVRFPSVLGREAGVQGYVAEHLRTSGFATESWDLNDSIKQQPNAGESNVPFPGRPNVTGKRAGQGGGRSLIMNGHIDVVSAEPVSAWRYDPWAAQIVGDRMYGRGAYDMKSGVALNLFLGRLLNDLDIPLKGDFTIHSVIEEECTGNGALAASLRDRADACIVTEPHFGDYTRAHLGVMWFRVAIEGKSAHAGHAWQGVNAIVKAAPIVLALRDLDNRMNEQVHPLWEGLTHPINLNVGVIRGGDWPSTVPGDCHLHCRVSFFPNMTKEQLRGRSAGRLATGAPTGHHLRRFPDRWGDPGRERAVPEGARRGERDGARAADAGADRDGRERHALLHFPGRAEHLLRGDRRQRPRGRRMARPHLDDAGGESAGQVHRRLVRRRRVLSRL
jgi:acetylornithine deacetylase